MKEDIEEIDLPMRTVPKNLTSLQLAVRRDDHHAVGALLAQNPNAVFEIDGYDLREAKIKGSPDFMNDTKTVEIVKRVRREQIKHAKAPQETLG